MVSLSDLTQKQWLAACKRLGLVVDVSKGKGSHARVYMPNAPKSMPMTIPNHMNKITNIKTRKKLIEWGFSEKEINKALKIR